MIRGRIRHSYLRPNREVGGGGGKLIIGQFYFWRERGEGIWSDSEDIFIKMETERVVSKSNTGQGTLVLIRPPLRVFVRVLVQ